MSKAKQLRFRAAQHKVHERGTETETEASAHESENDNNPFAETKGVLAVLDDAAHAAAKHNLDFVVSTDFASPDCGSVGCEKMRAAMFAAKNMTGDSLVPGHPIWPSDAPGQAPDIMYTKNEIMSHAKAKKRQQIADDDEANGLVAGVRIEVTAEMEDLVAELERIVAKRETLQKIEAALQSSATQMTEQLGRTADDTIQMLREENERLHAEIKSKDAALAQASEEEDEGEYLDGGVHGAEAAAQDVTEESKAEEAAESKAEEAAEEGAEDEAAEEKAEADAEDAAGGSAVSEEAAESKAEEAAEEGAEDEAAEEKVEADAEDAAGESAVGDPNEGTPEDIAAAAEELKAEEAEEEGRR